MTFQLFEQNKYFGPLLNAYKFIYLLFLFLFCSVTTASYAAFYKTNNKTNEDTKSGHKYEDDVQMMVLIPGNV